MCKNHTDCNKHLNVVCLKRARTTAQENLWIFSLLLQHPEANISPEFGFQHSHAFKKMALIKHNTTKWYCAICIHYRLFSQQWEINVDVWKSNLFLITTEYFTRELICQLSCGWHFDCFFPILHLHWARRCNEPSFLCTAGCSAPGYIPWGKLLSCRISLSARNF